MSTLIVILIIIACILLIAVVLIQNPKGGGLSQSFGGFSNQIMGVQRTTDFLEKATWGLIIGVAVLSLFTVFFFDKAAPVQNSGLPASRLEQQAPAAAAPAAPSQPQQAPAQQAPAQQAPANSNTGTATAPAPAK